MALSDPPWATEEEEGRPARKVRRITRLQVHEGSLVDRPANELCQVVLWKRDQDEDGDEVFEADRDVRGAGDGDAGAGDDAGRGRASDAAAVRAAGADRELRDGAGEAPEG